MSPGPLDKALGILSGVPIEIEAEMDRLSLSLQTLLDLRPGSKVPLGRTEDDLLDIYVGGVRIARGRMSEVNNKMYIEITEVGNVE